MLVLVVVMVVVVVVVIVVVVVLLAAGFRILSQYQFEGENKQTQQKP